jgi:hypothetical protein
MLEENPSATVYCLITGFCRINSNIVQNLVFWSQMIVCKTDSKHKVNSGISKIFSKKVNATEPKKVTIDNEISMVMMSFGPGDDPESSFKKLNPLRWWK